MRYLRNTIFLLLFLGLIGGSAWGLWVYYKQNQPQVLFRVEPVTRGPLLVTIEASGTLMPEEVVDVGARVAGRITRFGVDPKDSSRHVDYSTDVDEGTILAYIDDLELSALVDEAKANLARANASLNQARTQLKQAQRNRLRVEDVRRQTFVPEEEYDAVITAHEAAQSMVEVAEADVKVAEVALAKANINLEYTVIRSPIKGVIVDRRVNVGQTVVANLNAPSLFLIAKDLTRMEVWVSVNEADVGQLREGQKVTFTVDAFRNKAFEGRIGQIRLNASVTQNVVTYPVIVKTENDDGKLLRPYMTANLKFHVDRRDNVLMVPNAALRYTPDPERIAPEYRDSMPSEDSSGASRAKREPIVWVVEGGFAKPVKLSTGITDGKHTEVVEVLQGEISEGTEVITGEEEVKSNEEAVNPFAPKGVFKRRSTPTSAKK